MTSSVIVALSACAGLVIVDQLLKIWVLSSLAGLGSSVMLIPGLLQLTYVENRGAAFGIMQGRVGILSLLTLAVIIFCIVLLIRKVRNRMAATSLALIVAGGLGNLIDRVFRGFVVDFLDVSPLFSFPVFNFADCCVVIGTILLLIYLFFFDETAKKKDKAEPPTEPEQQS